MLEVGSISKICRKQIKMSKVFAQKIKPYLWFDHQAAEAAKFYCSLFPHAKIISRSEMIVEFELEGMRFMALNGGPKYPFTEAISLFVLCEDQAEIDHLWNNLTRDGGQESSCGWCKDKFGLSWQIVPKRFMEMMETGSPAQTQKVIETMMPMNKMIVADFEQAFQIKT